ncbi:MAG: PQQ-binding-like beta-propeller repeat protein [Lacipirellulaceae bacterium]
MRRLALLVIAVGSIALSAVADDWPQWRGPLRDGVWREAGVADSLPAEPEVRWRVPCALGYAGPAVASGKVYLFEYDKRSGEVTNNPGGRDELEGTERLRALDLKTGDELWRHEYERPYQVSYPSGPRATPTVDGDLVYIVGAEGDLRCLKTAGGELVWKKSYAEDFGVETPIWGHSSHPLVDGETLYCVVGGEGSVAVAFDKRTGAEKWRAVTAYEPGYCPPAMIEQGGKPLLVVFHPVGATALDPATGDELWSIPLEPSYGMSIAQPLQVGDKLFVSGYGGVSVLLKLSAEADGKPEVLWSGTPKTSMSCANSSPLAIGETIYGCDANASALVAVSIETGDRLWEEQAPTMAEGQRGRHGTAFVVRQGDTDRVWLASESGDLVLARLSPEKYEELGRAKLLEPTGSAFGRSVLWSHPAFADRAIIARNDKEIVCVELGE